MSEVSVAAVVSVAAGDPSSVASWSSSEEVSSLEVSSAAGVSRVPAVAVVAARDRTAVPAAARRRW
jgi:hypothetical protein